MLDAKSNRYRSLDERVDPVRARDDGDGNGGDDGSSDEYEGHALSELSLFVLESSSAAFPLVLFSSIWTRVHTCSSCFVNAAKGTGLC